MNPNSNAAPATATRRIYNTDQRPNAVENTITLVTKLRQEGWTSADLDYRYVVSSWTGDNYEAVDILGNRLSEVLAELTKS